MDWLVDNQWRDIVSTFNVLDPATGTYQTVPVVLRKGEKMRVGEGLAIEIRKRYMYAPGLVYSKVDPKLGPEVKSAPERTETKPTGRRYVAKRRIPLIIRDKK